MLFWKEIQNLFFKDSMSFYSLSFLSFDEERD